MKTVYPVYVGPHIQYIPGVPAIEQTLSDKDAQALVDTGAFTYKKPKAPAPAEPEPTPEQES